MHRFDGLPYLLILIIKKPHSDLNKDIEHIPTQGDQKQQNFLSDKKNDYKFNNLLIPLILLNKV